MAEGHGALYRMRIKPGAEAELVALLEEWERHRKPNVPGPSAGHRRLRGHLEADPEWEDGIIRVRAKPRNSQTPAHAEAPPSARLTIMIPRVVIENRAQPRVLLKVVRIGTERRLITKYRDADKLAWAIVWLKRSAEVRRSFQAHSP